MLSSPFSETQNKALFLTYLVVHLKCDVKLQDDQHELEPGAHLVVMQRNVDGKHNVVGLDLLGHGLFEAPDLLALVLTPWHEPFCLLTVLGRVHTLGSQVVDRCGGAGSWRDKYTREGRDVRLDVMLKYCSNVFQGPTKPNIPQTNKSHKKFE